MTAQELINKLQDAILHGVDADAEVLGFDPDCEDWYPITTLVLTKDSIRLYTDED